VRFHEAIMRGAANPVLADAVRATRQAVLALGVSTVGWSRTMSDIVEEHVPIVDALRAGDPDAAEAAMTRHLTHTRDLMVERAAAGVTRHSR
jgi:DNA-binding GntR family transcriptional regulator